MQRRVLAVFVLLFVPALSSAAAPEPIEADYNAIIRQFYDLLREQKSAVAIDYVFGTNPALKTQPTQALQVKSQLGAIEPLLGELRGYDVIVSKVVAGRHAYVFTLVSFETQPMKMEFVFYKPKDRWMLVNYSFHTDYTAELRSLAWAEAGVGRSLGQP